MKFAKIRDVKSPVRGTDKSAGIDFFVPNYSEDFVKVFREKNPQCPNNEEGFVIRAHKRVLIPAGIKVRIPDNTALVAFNKSGVFSKKGLSVGACVVDADYTGELHISMFNSDDTDVKVAWGEKIVQFILLPVLFPEISECDSEELLYENFESDRGSGGFGSTGTN